MKRYKRRFNLKAVQDTIENNKKKDISLKQFKSWYVDVLLDDLYLRENVKAGLSYLIMDFYGTEGIEKVDSVSQHAYAIINREHPKAAKKLWKPAALCEKTGKIKDVKISTVFKDSDTSDFYFTDKPL